MEKHAAENAYLMDDDDDNNNANSSNVEQKKNLLQESACVDLETEKNKPQEKFINQHKPLLKHCSLPYNFKINPIVIESKDDT